MRERTSTTPPSSVELYVVFQVPDHDRFVEGVAVVATVTGVEGVDGVTAAVAEAGVVVTRVVPGVVVQPAAIIMMQMKPARIIDNDFFIERSLNYLFQRQLILLK